MREIFFCFSILMIGCSASVPEEAKKSASEFVQNTPNATSFSCASVDSDGDGYCACTVFMRDSSPFRIDCGCQRFCVWNCARGCKIVEGFKVRQ